MATKKTRNPWIGEVEIEIGGNAHMLRYSLNKIAELEALIGKPISEIFRDGQVGITSLRAAIYVGIKRKHDRKLTLITVGNWMDPSQLAYYGALAGEALSLCLTGNKPEDDDVDDDDEDEENEGNALEKEEVSNGQSLSDSRTPTESQASGI